MKNSLLHLMPGLVSLVKEEVGANIDKVDMLTFSMAPGMPFGVIATWSGKALPARWAAFRFMEDGRLVVVYRGEGNGNSR